MCPAIHINSRSWLRSSSTHEPSDPPLRVVSFIYHTCATVVVVERRRQSRRSLSATPSTVMRSDNNRDTRKTKRQGQAEHHRPCAITAQRPTSDGSLNLRKGLELYDRDLLTARSTNRSIVRATGTSNVSASLATVSAQLSRCYIGVGATSAYSLMILPQVHLRKPCYDFYFL